MKTDIKLDENWDIDITERDLQQVKYANYAAQNLRQTLQVFRGEYFRDFREGVPYFQNIFKKGTSNEIIKKIFKNKILEQRYVKNVSFVRIERNNKREAEITFKALLINGETLEMTV